MGAVKGDREEGVGEEGEVCSVGTFHEGEGGVGGTWDEGEDRNVAAWVQSTEGEGEKSLYGRENHVV